MTWIQVGAPSSGTNRPPRNDSSVRVEPQPTVGASTTVNTSKSIALVKPASPGKSQLLQRAGSTLVAPHFSPDERWIAFAARTEPVGSRVYLAPLRGESAAGASEWVALTKDKAWESVPQWSPDGKLVYFISNRDGQRCIWARRFEGGKVAGEPFAVHHFHDMRRSPANTAPQATDLFVGRDQMVIAVGEVSGSLWIIDPQN